jgi:hypothetical protein
MARIRTTNGEAGGPAAPLSFTQRLREIDLFFQGKNPVHQTMRRAAHRLERVGIPYAVVGGMAVNAHRYQRTTADVDLLLTADGLAAFRRRFVGKNYARVPGHPVRFVDLPTLVQLKLAARRHKDFGDVVELIGVHNLDESFGEQLHASVHGDYIKCLEEKRREEAYAARRARLQAHLKEDKCP